MDGPCSGSCDSSVFSRASLADPYCFSGRQGEVRKARSTSNLFRSSNSSTQRTSLPDAQSLVQNRTAHLHLHPRQSLDSPSLFPPSFLLLIARHFHPPTTASR